ncbi:ADP-ribosylation factor 1-like [Gigantopelta aegis]|uniref:ADP-ribosylation factor 1-like n=1 Tax=Gigantopelta aegis TaxID=1735272 RepID=UPI001B88C83D|nr:ADP-ribosylation factor 1-like [Gigantopelta aegis]
MGCRTSTVAIKILFIGPTGAGKDFLVQALQVGVDKVVSRQPTEAFTVEYVKSPRTNLKFVVYNLSGNPYYRRIFKEVYPGIQGVVLVVNCADHSHIDDARDVLEELDRPPELRGLPVLVVANKVELEGALSVDELKTTLDLDLELAHRKWWICELRTNNQHDVDKIMKRIDRFVVKEKKKSKK